MNIDRHMKENKSNKRNSKSKSRPFPKTSHFARGLFSPFALLTSLLLSACLETFYLAQAQTVCPVETPPFGGAVLDGSPDEYETYIAITDDEYTRMTRLKYCKCCINGAGVHEHFRGFEVTLESPTTGQTYVQEFGTIDGTEPDTFCETFEMPEELMFLTVFADSNDVEGLIFEDYAQTEFIARANGALTSGRQQLGGRPIGFRVTMGQGGRDNQPLVMSVVYNQCNCPASTFIGNQTPVDMTIEALVGAPQTQEVKYQDNYMRFVYGQDCGSYGVEITPSYPFLTEQTTGLNVDENGNPYLDELQLTAGTLADVGRYPVQMKVFQDPANPDHGYSLPYRGIVPTEIYEFFITITPCQVNSYTTDLTMSDITYNLGDPSVTQGTFSFVQNNACGYPETISMTGLPAWVTYDDANRDFTVPLSSDPARVGQYPVTITSELSVPTDYTKTAFITISATNSFTIFVNPCIVTNYQNVPINDMIYTISEPTLFSEPAPLEFIQDPMCGYVPTVTVAPPGLPAFMTFDSVNQRYTIPQTFDKSLHGTYTFTIQSQISFFSDSSKSSTTTLTTSQTVQVQIIDPCISTVLDPLFINDMERFVKQTELLQSFPNLQDSASQVYGPQDGVTFCGNRVCEIVSPPSPPPAQYSPFLTFDPLTREFRVQTDDVAQIGNYSFEMTCYLNDYPTNSQTATFNVNIYTCQVSTLTPTPVVQQRYNVYTPQISWNVAEFVQDPDCQHPLVYTYELYDAASNTYSPLPSWINVPSERNFEVFTNDPTQVGLYTIAVTATVPLALMNPEFKETLFIDLEVLNECETDSVIPLSSIPYQLYYIAEDPQRSFNPSWNSLIAGCPTFFDIEIEDSGIWRPLNGAELAVISFDSTDGSFSFQTSDYALDGQIWTLNVFKKSTYSVGVAGKGDYIFDLEFRDICWDSTLTAAEFLQPEYIYDLWQAQDLRYSQMVDSSQGLACGGFTYEIEYLSGPIFDSSQPLGADLSSYTTTVLSLFEIQMQATINDMSWVGIHMLRIKSTLGQTDLAADARGNQGLYNSLYSQDMKLTILNPCVNSIVNADNGLVLTDLQVPSGQTLITLDFNGPTDSASVTYGNGYDKCGPLTYELTNPVGDPYQNSFFDKLFGAIPDQADQNQFKLASASVGTDLESLFILKIKLTDYPFSTGISIPITLKYRECFPQQLSRKIEDQTVQVGDAPTSIDYFFDQFPCSYDQTYKVEILDVDTREVLVQPAFITTEDLLITFADQTQTDVGKYIVRVISTIDNSLKTEASSEFLLTVKAEDTVVIGVNVTPDFLVNLQDQRVKVGQSLVYTPGLKSNTYGFIMTVEVILGDAFRFASYDTAGNIFRVAGSETTRQDEGQYEIFVTATFKNSTYEEKYEKKFILTVWDDPLPPDPLPNDVIYYEEWTMPIVEDVEPWKPEQEQDPERPIPYIADMTSTGMLVIGWDKEMKPPQNITVIPPTKIAHKDYKNIDAYRFTPIQRDSRFNGRRRQLQTQQYFGPVVGNKFSNLGKEENEDNLVWFANRTDLNAERMALLDALELRIKSQNAMPDDKLVEFTWDIMGYDTDYIWLQIYIQNPWEVSQNGQTDTISVTFWGVDYFKSKQGKEVMYGTTLYQSIFRQLDLKEAENVDGTDQRGWFLASILLISPFVMVGSLLPTWMFINSLQLIAHLPLLNSLMPGNAHYFLNKYLDLVRWHNSDLQLWFDSTFEFKKYALDEGLYHKFLQACGYQHLYAQNLIIVIAAVLLIGLVWTLIKIKDFLASRKPFKKNRLNKRDEPMVTNFALRFFYEFFLEFAICITLNLSIVDFNEFSPSFQFTSSVLVAVGIIALVAFVSSLLCKRGPYARNFYQPGTALESFWGARPTNQDFDESKFFKKNPPPKIKPWGSFIMRIDLDKVEAVWNKVTCRNKNNQSTPDQDIDTKKPVQKDIGSPRKKNTKIMQAPVDEIVENQMTIPTERKLLETDRDIAAPQIEEQNTHQGTENQSENEHHSNQLSARSSSFVSSNVTSSQESSSGSSGQNSSSNSQQSISDSSNSQSSSDFSRTNRDPQDVYEGGEQIYTNPEFQQQTQRAFMSSSNQNGWNFSQGTDTQISAKKSKEKSSLDSEKNSEVKRQAKLAIEIEESLRKPARYKTLHYGLKVNHPRNVAIIHPLMFFMRRIILACIIVFLDEIPLLGTWLFMGCTLIMLAYVLTEQQWSDKIITRQHIYDEITIYILSVMLLCYTNFVSPEMRYILGFVLIGIVFAFVIYNTIIMLVFALRIALKYLRRIYVLIIRNKLNSESQKISAKIIEDTKGWRGPLYDKKHKKPLKEPKMVVDDLEKSDQQIRYRFETHATIQGGQQGRLYAIKKENPNDISVIMEICDYIDMPTRRRSTQHMSGLFSDDKINSNSESSEMVEEKSSGNFFCPDDVSEDERLQLQNLNIQEIVEEVDIYGNSLGKKIINEKDYIVKKDEEIELEVKDDEEMIRNQHIIDEALIDNATTKVNQIGLSDFNVDNNQQNNKRDVKRDTNYSNQFGESQFSQVKGRVVNKESTDLSMLEQTQRRLKHNQNQSKMTSQGQEYEVSSVQCKEQSSDHYGGNYYKKNRLTSAQSQNTIIEIPIKNRESYLEKRHQEKYNNKVYQESNVFLDDSSPVLDHSQPHIEEEKQIYTERFQQRPSLQTYQIQQQIQDIAPPINGPPQMDQSANISAISTIRQSLPGRDINLQNVDHQEKDNNSQSTILRFQSINESRLTPLNFNQKSAKNGFQQQQSQEVFVDSTQDIKKLNIKRVQEQHERLSQSMIPIANEFKLLHESTTEAKTPRPEESLVNNPQRSVSKETIKREHRHHTMVQNGQGIMIGTFPNQPNQADIARGKSQISSISANSRQIIRNVSGPLNNGENRNHQPPHLKVYQKTQQVYDLSSRRHKRGLSQAHPSAMEFPGLQDDQYSILDNNFVVSSQISQAPTPMQNSVERPKKQQVVTQRMVYSNFQPPNNLAQNFKYSLKGDHTSPDKINRASKDMPHTPNTDLQKAGGGPKINQEFENQTKFQAKNGSVTPQTENFTNLISAKKQATDLFQEPRLSAEPKTWRNIHPHTEIRQVKPTTPAENNIMRVFNINVQGGQQEPIEDWPHQLRPQPQTNSATTGNVTPHGNHFIRGTTMKAMPVRQNPYIVETPQQSSISPNRLARNMTVRERSSDQFDPEQNSASFVNNRQVYVNNKQTTAGYQDAYSPIGKQGYLQVNNQGQYLFDQRQPKSHKNCKRGRTLERNQTLRVPSQEDPFELHMQERGASVEQQELAKNSQNNYGIYALQQINTLSPKDEVYPFGTRTERQQTRNHAKSSKELDFSRKKF